MNIEELLIKRGGFTELEKPEILTSGEVGVYYVNTERLLGDGSEFYRYGDRPSDMIAYACGVAREDPPFDKIIDILSERVKELISADDVNAVSGGQRRDWLFSGPVAKRLGLPHISLYKNDSSPLVIYPDGEDRVNALFGFRAVHVADLITEGSSFYRIEDGVEKGWIPSLRTRNASIEHAVSVISRCQGGEERLEEQGVKVSSLVKIDKTFLLEHSFHKERNVGYLRNPSEFVKEWLKENGATSFIDCLDPNAMDSRGKRFVRRYRETLIRVGKWDEFRKAVRKKYRRDVERIGEND